MVIVRNARWFGFGAALIVAFSFAGFAIRQSRQAAPARPATSSVAEAESEEHFDPIFYYHGLNLLAATSGGRVVKAVGKGWESAIDGAEDEQALSKNAEAVFGFRNGKPAVFSRCSMFIPEANEANVKEFELLYADSEGGPFTSIGKFDTQNQKATDSGYQDFNFQPATARYLKVRILQTYGWPNPVIHELRLFGAQP